MKLAVIIFMKVYHLILIVLLLLLPVKSGFAWGTPHITITRAALNVLPDWQQDLLGEELEELGAAYCLIPDHVYTDKENAKFAKMESKPEILYLLNLHLPASQQQENLQTLSYFFGRAVQALREEKTGEAARYMGTVCHQLEDYGSPSHAAPGDNMFTLLQQFLPASEEMKGKLLHSPVESGYFTVSIAEYRPVLLGATVEEASWRLMHRMHEGILNARSTTIPIIQALYDGDKKRVEKLQQKAAVVDAKIVADALYTILSLGAKKFVDLEISKLDEVPIDAFFPVEAESLYYPQSQFFSKPNWGYPQNGFILAGGDQSMPLKLRVSTAGEVVVKEYDKGISAGMGRSLTFLLPKGVYQRFKVLAGLHPVLGKKGRVVFTLKSEGKVLLSRKLTGYDPAVMLECDVSELSQIELKLETARESGVKVDAKGNYAIWAQPVLLKK